MSDPNKQTSLQVDERTGYTVETVAETLPGGQQAKTTKLLTPLELITRELTAMHAADPSLTQASLYEAVERVQAGPTKGHKEAVEWLCADFDNWAAVAGRFSALVSYPTPQKFEGYSDARLAANQGSGIQRLQGDYKALKRAIRKSARRVGEHEREAVGSEWQGAARLEALKGRARRDKEGDLTAQSASGDIRTVTFALDAVIEELHLKSDEAAYLRHFGARPRSEMPDFLTTETGESWDARRVDRVRKRLAYRWPEVKAAAERHRITLIHKGMAVKVATSKNPAGSWMHIGNKDLLTRD
jgi:hypothetical protein